MTGDHLLFLSIAAVLFISAINAVLLNRQHGGLQGQAFWFWGLIALTNSYAGFGFSAWLGSPALTVANFGLLLAYLAMSLQLRYWRTGKSNIPLALILLAIVYTIALETLRAFEPYIVRLHLIHTVMTVITGYLFWSAIRYYRTTKSPQLIVLASTFAIEFLCASARLLFTLVQPDATNQHMTLYDEPVEMIVIRWIWLLANAMSYMTVMTYELEKSLDKNEALRALLKEKGLLLNALSRINRSDTSAAIGRTLSHELRQPLTTLLLATSNLKAKVKSDDLSRLSEHVDLLCRESQRSADLMNQLEEVFRPTGVASSSIELAKPLNQSIKVLRARLTAENIALTIKGETTVFIKGDLTQIETVFINLISNSINALTYQGLPKKIDIEITQDNSNAVVHVFDNGRGIDESVLPNLWQLYMTDESDGSGIGLWLSRQIVQKHGGSIEGGNNPKVGAWFRARLPLSLPVTSAPNQTRVA